MRGRLVDFVQAGRDQRVHVAYGVDEDVRVERAGRQGFRPVIFGAERDGFAPVVRSERGLDAEVPTVRAIGEVRSIYRVRSRVQMHRTLQVRP